MATNFISDGETLTLAAPYAVASGAGALVGAIFGVALATYASGATGVFAATGVWTLTKAGSQAWTVGQKVYWDDTNKVATNVATSNTFIGHAVEAVGSGAGETLGRVRLHGAPT